MESQRDALCRFSVEMSYARGELGQNLRKGGEPSLMGKQLRDIFRADGTQASSLEDVEDHLGGAIEAAKSLLNHVGTEETELIDDILRPLLEGYNRFSKSLSVLRDAVGQGQVPQACERPFKVAVSKISTSLNLAEARLRFMTQEYIQRRKFLTWMAHGLFHELEYAEIEVSDITCLFALKGRSVDPSTPELEKSISTRNGSSRKRKTTEYYKNVAAQLDLLMPASVGS